MTRFVWIREQTHRNNVVDMKGFAFNPVYSATLAYLVIPLSYESFCSSPFRSIVHRIWREACTSIPIWVIYFLHSFRRTNCHTFFRAVVRPSKFCLSFYRFIRFTASKACFCFSSFLAHISPTTGMRTKFSCSVFPGHKFFTALKTYSSFFISGVSLVSKRSCFVCTSLGAGFSSSVMIGGLKQRLANRADSYLCSLFGPFSPKSFLCARSRAIFRSFLVILMLLVERPTKLAGKCYPFVSLSTSFGAVSLTRFREVKTKRVFATYADFCGHVITFASNVRNWWLGEGLCEWQTLRNVFLSPDKSIAQMYVNGKFWAPLEIMK